MAYRNGTYVAFDGLDTTNPTAGDIKYFNILKLWKKVSKKDSLQFEFSDSHKKTSQVRDTSSEITLDLLHKSSLALVTALVEVNELVLLQEIY